MAGSWPVHSRSKNGVAEFTLGLAEGKTRGLAYGLAIHVFLRGRRRKTWMHAFAGMTAFGAVHSNCTTTAVP